VRVGIAGQPVADWHFPNIVPSNGDAARVGREPRLTAAECDVGIASGQNIQAGALINPELSYEQDNSFGSGRYRGTRSAFLGVLGHQRRIQILDEHISAIDRLTPLL
jgi:outer membrane protein, heavy metal efflux system